MRLAIGLCFGGLSAGCTGDKVVSACSHAEEPPCVDGRTIAGSQVDPGYCFRESNHGCEGAPVESRVELSIGSFTRWGSSENGFSRDALDGSAVANAVSETIDWWNVNADSAYAKVTLVLGSTEVPEAEFTSAYDEIYTIGMYDPERTQLLFKPDDLALTACWSLGGETVDCDIAFRSVGPDPEYAKWLSGKRLPLDPLRLSRYVAWATGLPREETRDDWGQFSLRYVLAHELGHVLGFAEARDLPESLMGRPGQRGLALPIDLTCEDRRAVLFLYCPSGGEVVCSDLDVASSITCPASG